MILLGVTGGIGMGKSAAEGLLREQGVPVVDTDSLARELVEPGQVALQEIADAFGREILDHKGTLRREALASIVFSDAEARSRLESILHPKIRSRWTAEAEAWRARGERVGAVVIPLLFETSAETSFDVVVCVACSAVAQRQRLQARGWTSEVIAQRLAAQWPVEKKMRAADFAVWTEGELDLHRLQWKQILSLMGSAV